MKLAILTHLEMWWHALLLRHSGPVIVTAVYSSPRTVKRLGELFVSALTAYNMFTATVPGKILHLDHTQGNHLKTFADWLMLTRMDALVSSRSGFSETAAWFGSVPARGLVRASTCLFSGSVELPEGADAF